MKHISSMTKAPKCANTSVNPQIAIVIAVLDALSGLLRTLDPFLRDLAKVE
jgi:hypothetical protein